MSEPSLAAIGARLRALREERGITQAQAAAAAGMPRPGYTLLEGGRRGVGVVELWRLANLFGVSVDSFLRPDVPDAQEVVWVVVSRRHAPDVLWFSGWLTRRDRLLERAARLRDKMESGRDRGRLLRVMEALELLAVAAETRLSGVFFSSELAAQREGLARLSEIMTREARRRAVASPARRR